MAVLPAVPASAATGTTSFVRWSSSADFTQGTSVGLAATSGALTLGKGTSVLSYDDPRVSGGASSAACMSSIFWLDSSPYDGHERTSK